MATTYSTIFRYSLIGNGEQSGSWGTTTNTNIGTLIEQSIAGYSLVTHNDAATYTLTTNDGAADQARRMYLSIDGTLTANRSVAAPDVPKLYSVKNATVGGYSITFKNASGTGPSISNGKKRLVVSDGTDFADALDEITNLNVTGDLGLSAGSVSAPSVRPTTDTNTGIYWPGADEIAITVGGTARLAVASSGNVSIGAAAGSESLRVVPVASAVNWVQVGGAATGNPVTISALGSDTNIGITMAAKGTGGHLLNTNSTVTQLAVPHTASAVNYLSLTGSITTAALSVTAAGSDTNIGLTLAPKGTGSLLVTTGGGTQLAVTNTASASRYATITGSNGGAPVLSTSAGNLQISPASDLILQPSAGNVAIGTSTASSLLTVNGELEFTKAATGLKFQDGTTQTTAAVTGAFTTYEESAEQAITAGSTITVAHSLGAKPKLLQAHLVCKAPDLNYSIGDEADIASAGIPANARSGLQLLRSATDFIALINSDGLWVVDKTSYVPSAITAASWRLVFRGAV